MVCEEIESRLNLGNAGYQNLCVL